MLAGVLATALISGLLVRDAERETEARARQVVLQDAVHSAAALSRRLMERQRSLWVAAQTLPEPARWDASSGAHPGLAVLFDEVVVADPQGQLFSARAEDRPLQALLPRQPGFLTTVQASRPMVWVLPRDTTSVPRSGAATAPLATVFTQPVLRDGRVQAVLVGIIWLRRTGLMSDVVEPGPDFGEGAISQLLAITDNQGRRLVDGALATGTTQAAPSVWLSVAMRQWRDQGSPVESDGLVWSDGDQIVVAAGIPGPDWVIWRAYSRAAMMAPLDALRVRSLRWALGTWAGLSLVLLLYLGWQLSPLAQLERRVVALLDGDQAPQDGWPVARGEIGALSATLHSVALALAHKDHENHQLLERLESVMAAAPLGLAFLREDRLTLVNAELARLLGYAPSELRGLPARLLLADVGDADRMLGAIQAALREGRAYVGEHSFLRQQGNTFWGQLHASEVRPGQPEAGMVWTLSDITAQVQSRHQLEWSATHDALTGLLNRRGFQERMERFIEGRLRRPTALLVIDLDHFKPINDSEGHQAGDAMLQAVAGALNDGVRVSDAVGRLGGDEFAVLLEGCPPQWAQRLAHKLLERVQAVQVPWNGRQLQVSASIGLAMWEDRLGSVASWTHQADLACYEAKRAGRANVQASAAEPVGEALPG
nr:sensor domain-containing diguanylate cyclase [Ideonella oryzae]